jgi:hypothetical protein
MMQSGYGSKQVSNKVSSQNTRRRKHSMDLSKSVTPDFTLNTCYNNITDADINFFDNLKNKKPKTKSKHRKKSKSPFG